MPVEARRIEQTSYIDSATQKRERIFETLSDTIKQDLSYWAPQTSLADFLTRAQWRYDAEFSPQDLARGFLFLKKEQLKSPTNPINYIAQVASGLVDTDALLKGYIRISPESDRAQAALRETLSNMKAMVSEHPLTDSVREDSRSYKWRTTADNLWQLLLDYKPFDQVHQDAIATTQKDDCELLRYLENERAYHHLRDGRQAGDRRAYVVFSPSPETITSVLYERGYRGNSYIEVSQYDEETHAEQSTQYWFRIDGWEDLSTFLSETMGKNIAKNANDVEMMHQSDFVSDDELSQILDFVSTKRGKVSEHKDKITDYVKYELSNSIEQGFSELLLCAAQKLLKGEDITQEMQSIVVDLTFEQNLFNRFIAEVGKMPVKYTPVSDAELEYFKLNADARALFVQKNKLELVGCGGSFTFDKSDIFGLKDTRLSKSDVDQFGSLSFECPNCHAVVRRPKGELIENCPHCHKSVRCDAPQAA